MATMDPNQPSPKALNTVKSKNNISDLLLKRELEVYEKERASSVLNLDHDRLELLDFLRQLKICSTDELPESKHWLGQRDPRNPDLKPQRTLLTAPGGATRRTKEEATRDAKTAPAKETGQEREYEDGATLFCKKYNSAQPQTLNIGSIYQKRNEYMADNEPKWGLPEEEEDKDKDSSELSSRSQTPYSVSGISLDGASFSTPSEFELINGAGNRPGSAPSGENYDAPRGPLSKKEKLDLFILKTQRAAADKKKKKQVRVMPPRGKAKEDFMKELLVGNARRRYRRNHRVPLEDRIQEFFEKLEELKKRDKESRDPKSLADIRRRWTLLTQGVKAALEAETDDEDYNPDNTV